MKNCRPHYFFSMPKYVFRVVCLDIEISRPHYFCAPKFFWTPYFAIPAKTLVPAPKTMGPRLLQ